MAKEVQCSSVYQLRWMEKNLYEHAQTLRYLVLSQKDLSVEQLEVSDVNTHSSTDYCDCN